MSVESMSHVMRLFLLTNTAHRGRFFFFFFFFFLFFV